MPHPTAVINVVGLSRSLMGDHAPRLSTYIDCGRWVQLKPVLPAVTCSVQSSMLTGKPVREHGIVGNGWYDRDLNEIQFWKQSNRLVQAEKVWEAARKRAPGDSVTCANICWWYNMATSADYTVTPRPIYKADGRKIPDCYTQPAELRDELQQKLGPFPLFYFWGPLADRRSSDWIVDASMFVYEKHHPTLTLVYLPHLDYCLQKLGPGHADIPRYVAEVDGMAGRLLDFFYERGVRTIIVSEYGIEPVDDAVAVNRVLREAGLLHVREEQGLELLDTGGSDAFAVCDHQIAHVYTKNAKVTQRTMELLGEVDGIEHILDHDGKAAAGLDHPRSGDLVLIAGARRWFCYDYWLDDKRAPDFARTVDIHRKPGYDPRELFIDPKLFAPKAHLAWKLLRKKLWFRQLMDVIPLDTKLVRGSHGRVDVSAEYQPVMLLPREMGEVADAQVLPCEAVRDAVLEAMFGRG